jgi:hypothetical protein
MATDPHHLNSRSRLRRSISFLIVVAAGAFASVAAPGTAAAYGWPIKPFDQQHPVRGFFGDPRIGMTPRRPPTEPRCTRRSPARSSCAPTAPR